MRSLRILKKKSRKAKEILIADFGYKEADFFLADGGEHYHDQVICSCRAVYCVHTHPLKGTPMFGVTSGYYEPEWEERSAFCQLRSIAMWTEGIDRNLCDFLGLQYPIPEFNWEDCPEEEREA